MAKLKEEAAAQHQQQQLSVKLVVNDDDLPSNLSSWNALWIMEAADGSNGNDVDMVDDKFDNLPGCGDICVVGGMFHCGVLCLEG